MNYQKYMRGAGQKSTQLAATTDDAKASPAASQGGDYQQYMDYAKYTQGASSGGAQSQGASAGGDYNADDPDLSDPMHVQKNSRQTWGSAAP
jgi:hypothetical protein